jgi:hypothetical protein
MRYQSGLTIRNANNLAASKKIAKPAQTNRRIELPLY